MENSNKELIQNLYSKVFGQGDLKYADSIIAENYIQHNPMVKTGKAGFMEFLAFLKQLPKPKNLRPPFKRVLAEGDLVAIHSKIEFRGKENATIELYRIENGLIAEHWDAVQEIKGSVPVVVGTVEIDPKEPTSGNKQRIAQFVEQIRVGKQFEKLSEFLADNLHRSEFETSEQSFRLHRIIGEHNFVLTQGECKIDGQPLVVYDLYRLSNNLIVEHWAVKQLVPDKMVHSNGMI